MPDVPGIKITTDCLHCTNQVDQILLWRSLNNKCANNKTNQLPLSSPLAVVASSLGSLWTLSLRNIGGGETASSISSEKEMVVKRFFFIPLPFICFCQSLTSHGLSGFLLNRSLAFDVTRSFCDIIYIHKKILDSLFRRENSEFWNFQVHNASLKLH